MSDDIRKKVNTTRRQGSDCRNNAHKVMNILNTILKNILLHKFRIRMQRQVLSCSIPAFHSSSNTSEIKNDDNEARVMASGAGKVSEDVLIKDAEIRRLIEEMRSTPKEEKQRLKEVSKCIKNVSVQRILEDFKGVRNIPGIEYKRLYEDKQKDDSEHELGDDDNYSSTDVHNNNTEETAGIPESTTEELQSAISKLKKGKSPDSKGIRTEDVKACDEETRDGETNLQRDHKQK